MSNGLKNRKAKSYKSAVLPGSSPGRASLLSSDPCTNPQAHYFKFVIGLPTAFSTLLCT